MFGSQVWPVRVSLEVVVTVSEDGFPFLVGVGGKSYVLELRGRSL